jgi:hypothetical protein
LKYFISIEKEKYYHTKLLKTKFLAVFATLKKFPGKADGGLPFLFHLCPGRYGNVIF